MLHARKTWPLTCAYVILAFDDEQESVMASISSRTDKVTRCPAAHFESAARTDFELSVDPLCPKPGSQPQAATGQAQVIVSIAVSAKAHWAVPRTTKLRAEG